MSGLDADGSPLNNRSNAPVYNTGEESRSPSSGAKVLLVMIGVTAGLVSLALLKYGPAYIHHTPEAKPDTVVAFSADPSGHDDSPIQLGYPDHIYSVTCTANNAKDCVLEVDNGTSHTIKRFPYVEQEWFSPGRKNRPYHTLDVILSLPSLNGNPTLKMGTDPVKNKDLVQVLRQNGWIAN